MAAKKTLKVAVVMTTAVTENGRVVYLNRGDVVPEGIAADSLEHLKGLGHITEDDVDQVPPAPSV